FVESYTDDQLIHIQRPLVTGLRPPRLPTLFPYTTLFRSRTSYCRLLRYVRGLCSSNKNIGYINGNQKYKGHNSQKPNHINCRISPFITKQILHSTNT